MVVFGLNKSAFAPVKFRYVRVRNSRWKWIVIWPYGRWQGGGKDMAGSKKDMARSKKNCLYIHAWMCV